MSKFELMLGWNLRVSEACVLFCLVDNGGEASVEDVRKAASRGSATSLQGARVHINRLRAKVADRGITIATTPGGYALPQDSFERVTAAIDEIDCVAWQRAVPANRQQAQGV